MSEIAAVIADVHERRSGIPRRLEQLGLAIEIKPLPAADYAVGSDILVERKTVRGVHAGILDGTFWRQIGKLRVASRFPFFLVEGEDLDDGPLSRSAIRGVCLAVVEQGVRLLRASDPEDSALWLHRLAARAAATSVDRPTYAQRPRPKPGVEAAEALLAAAPGISTHSARALLNHFGGVAEVLAADPKRWLEVRGIGAERARALAETLAARSQK